MSKKKLQIQTLGCSKNTVDSEHILYKLRDLYDIVTAEDESAYVDCMLLNTCGFIGDAKEESVNAVLQAVERKRQGLVGRVIVFGCLSQRYAAEMPELIPEVDEWYGARDFAPVIKALGGNPDGETGRFRTEAGHGKAHGPATEYLKISEGCDRRCSYCAIPHIRGGHHSVPIEELVAEARALTADGVKELVLIAQDTTYYGLDLYHRRALADLLDALSAIDGIEWIRIHYSYPADFPEDVLDRMASNPKVCPYIDIPLQHISDKLLDMMRRHVSKEWTVNLLRRIRERVPGVAVRTTMIVGHPGEGEEEFEELLDFVREARIERLGAFAYSEEEGTYGAEHFEDDIPEGVKHERLGILMDVQREISLGFNRSRIGTSERVLVDDWSDGVFVCRSRYESPEVDGEILVKPTEEWLAGRDPESLIGTFIAVTITGADEYDLIAQTE